MTETAAGFVLRLLHAATTAHLLHLGTRSHAAHLALGDLYEGLPGLVDKVAEAYQGSDGLLGEGKEDRYPSGYTPPAIDDDPKAFVRELCEYVDDNRAALGEDSAVQNLVDELKGLLLSTLYKLRFLD